MIRLSRRMVFVASNMSASTSCLRSAPGSRLVSAFNAGLDNHSIVFARRSSPADSEHANGRDQTTVDNGGEGGIRTHGTRKGSTVFETARFNRSRTSPDWACELIISNRPRLFGMAGGPGRATPPLSTEPRALASGLLQAA